jgi:MFS family permease
MLTQYRKVLRNAEFSRLWVGWTASSFGDSLTWVALVWLVYSRSHSSTAVSLLVIAYTAPVVLGGFVSGLALDRFDRRRLLIVVNVLLGLGVLSIPAAATILGQVSPYQVYGVAALYGLLKMANLAGLPSLIPSLVPEEELSTANALESISYTIAQMIGPVAAGLLIGVIGPANVLAIDVATYAIVIGALYLMSSRTSIEAAQGSGRGLGPAIGFLVRTPAILVINIMFMLFNVGEGMLSVGLPVYVSKVLAGGASEYGLLLGAMAGAGLVSSILVGGWVWRAPLGRSIAVAQVGAGFGVIGLAATNALALAIAALAFAGLMTAPLTIWAQTIRMGLIPADLRGRVFALLRTLMQATPPVGGAIAGLLLLHADVRVVLLTAALVIALPGLVGLAHPALGDTATRQQTAVID